MNNRCKHRCVLAIGNTSIIERCYRENNEHQRHKAVAVYKGEVIDYEWLTGDEWEVEE